MYNVEAVGLLGNPSPPVCNNAIGAVVERIYIAEIRCSFCCGVERQVRLVLTPRMDDGVIGISGTIAYLLFTNGFNFIAADSTDGGAYKECERISRSNTRRKG